MNDPNCTFETWDAGGAETYFYIPECQLARILQKDFGPGAAYFVNGRLVARQFRLPKRLVSLVIKRHWSQLFEEIGQRNGALDLK